MKTKQVRTKGKISLSRYFQELKKGDFVAVVKELAIKAGFPSRLQGRTGKVEEKRGKSYVIVINDQNKEKRFLINPLHLRKLK